MAPAESRSAPTTPDLSGARRRLALAKHADRRFGVVATRELMDLGFGTSTISDLVASGILVRVTHGVYAVGHRHLTREGWWNVAVRAGGEGSILSHRAAGAVRGVLRPVSAVDVIVTCKQGIKLPGIRSHRCVIDEVDREIVHGLPVTSLPRTMLDVAATEPRRRLEQALEEALRLGVYDHRAMLEALTRYKGRRGAARLRAAIHELPDDPSLFRSKVEREARDLLVAAGLPEPEVNAWFVTGPDGGYELDLFVRSLMLNLEIDGPRHDLPWQRARDQVRDAALAARGIHVERFPVALVDLEPAVFVAAVARLVGERR